MSVTLLIIDPWQYCVIMCMLYKIRCNPVHPLNGALPGPYVSVRVTRGHLIAHWYTYMRRLAVEPRSTAGLLFPSQCPSIWNDLANPVFDGVGLAGFKGRANAFLLV